MKKLLILFVLSLSIFLLASCEEEDPFGEDDVLEILEEYENEGMVAQRQERLDEQEELLNEYEERIEDLEEENESYRTMLNELQALWEQEGDADYSDATEIELGETYEGTLSMSNYEERYFISVYDTTYIKIYIETDETVDINFIQKTTLYDYEEINITGEEYSFTHKFPEFGNYIVEVENWYDHEEVQYSIRFEEDPNGGITPMGN